MPTSRAGRAPAARGRRGAREPGRLGAWWRSWRWCLPCGPPAQHRPVQGSPAAKVMLLVSTQQATPRRKQRAYGQVVRTGRAQGNLHDGDLGLERQEARAARGTDTGRAAGGATQDGPKTEASVLRAGNAKGSPLRTHLSGSRQRPYALCLHPDDTSDYKNTAPRIHLRRRNIEPEVWSPNAVNLAQALAPEPDVVSPRASPPWIPTTARRRPPVDATPTRPALPPRRLRTAPA